MVSVENDFDLPMVLGLESATLDVRRKKFSVFSDREETEGAFGLKLAKMVNKKEKPIGGFELMERLENMKVCAGGQRTAKWMFNQKYDIPSCCKRHNLLFPATVFKGHLGHLYIPYMRYEKKPGWYIQFCWLKWSFFGQSFRVVILRPPKKG